MSIVVRHSKAHVPAIGTAGLGRQDLGDGYRATLCFVAEDGSFVDLHVTTRHIEHLASLLAGREITLVELEPLTDEKPPSR